MQELLKRWVKGTPLERPARALHGLFVPPPPPSGDLYDAQTGAILERILAPDSHCVDVGCHRGTVLDEILRLAPAGTHLGLEPLPDLYAFLVDKYAHLSNVTIKDCALSDQTGPTTFQHVVNRPAYSGFLPRHYLFGHAEVVEVTVQRARLDDLLPPALPIRLIKIDVEGAELQVLRGSTATLQRWPPYVVFEHGKGAADRYGTRPEEVHDLFTACGMRLSRLGDWLDAPGRTTFSRRAFARDFNRGRNFYYFAHK